MQARQGPRPYVGQNPICLRGHDKRVVGVYGTSCAGCAHDYARNRARRDAEAREQAKARLGRRTATGTRFVELSPAQTVAVMDLRQKAETAMPWERAGLIAEAERLAGGAS